MTFINGAFQIKINTKGGRVRGQSGYSQLAKHMQDQYHFTVPTETQLCNHIQKCINEMVDINGRHGNEYTISSAGLLLQVSKVDGGREDMWKPQPCHLDLGNYNAEDTEQHSTNQLQGTFMLTKDSLGAIVYKMGGVPSTRQPKRFFCN